MRFEYEGEVRLLCQEGGSAESAIELHELVTETVPRGVTHGFLASWGGQEIGLSLNTALEQFAVEEADKMGDQSLGRLRITVERLSAR